MAPVVCFAEHGLNCFMGRLDGEKSTVHSISPTVTCQERIQCMYTYSCVDIGSDEVFSKILKKPFIVQKKIIPHMKAFGIFKKMVLGLVGLIDAEGIDVAQPTWL